MLFRSFSEASTVYVTHDQVEAMTLADKIVLLNVSRDASASGSIAQVGTPMDLYLRPNSRFVAGFIGSPQMNFLEGRVAAADGSGLTVDLPGLGRLSTRASSNQVAPGDKVSIGIRPEHIRAGHEGENNLTGAVAGVEQLGGLSYVRLADPNITIQIPGQTRLASGEPTPIHFPIEALHVFDADGMTLSTTS